MSTIYHFPYDSPIRYLPLVYILPYDSLIRCTILRKLPRSMGMLNNPEWGRALKATLSTMKSWMLWLRWCFPT